MVLAVGSAAAVVVFFLFPYYVNDLNHFLLTRLRAECTTRRISGHPAMRG